MPRRRRRRTLTAASALSIGALLVVEANAAEGPLELAWSAPAECPRGDAVEARVVRIIGGARAGDSSVRARADVDREGTRFRLSLHTTSGATSGERVITAESCEELADAAALILALAIAPARAAAAATSARSDPTPPSPTTGPPPPAAPPAAAPPPPTASAPPPLVSAAPPAPPALSPPRSPDRSTAPRPDARDEPSRPRRVAIGAELAGESGALAVPTYGVEIDGGARIDRVRLEAAFSLWAKQDAMSAARPSEGGRFSLWNASARGCFSLLHRRVDLAPCASFAIEHAGGTAVGATVSSNNAATWAAAGGGGLATVEITTSLALRSQIELLVPFVRPTFVVEQPAGGPLFVHRPAAVDGRGAIGLELRFF